MTFTKEWLQQTIEEMQEHGELFPGDLDEDHGKVLKALRIALAALKAEPVAYMHRSGQVVTREECCDDEVFAICCKVDKPLYAAPPTLVVPDGYALVPVEPTHEMLNAWLSEVANWRGHVAGYKAMLAAAAPQQEAKP